MNAYDLVKDVRALLSEDTEAHWSDRTIVQAINAAQNRYYMKLSMTPGDWLLKKSSALTPVSGLVDLPADCAKPVYMEEVLTGREIPIDMSIRERSRTRLEGQYFATTSPRAHMIGNQIEINQADYTKLVYLWYEQRCLKLLYGTASAGGAGSLALQANMPLVLTDDYYNSSVLQIREGTGSPASVTITDYVGATKTLTLTGTYDTDSVYGLDSVLPEEFADAMLHKSTMLCAIKPASVVSDDFLKWLSSETRSADALLDDWIATRVKNRRRIIPSEGYYD